MPACSFVFATDIECASSPANSGRPRRTPDPVLDSEDT
jgi:hypothetical protein